MSPNPASRSTPPLPLLALAAGALLSLTPVATPALALGLGGLLALTMGNPLAALTARAAKLLLQLAVVGLGFGMPLAALLAAGRSGVGYTIAGIALTLVLGLVLGRFLRIERQLSFLITAGTSICGGSAIAAVGPAIRASSEAMSVAMATVFLLNAVALYVFPVVGKLLQLSQHQFAIWAAIAIHDTSSVVGAAASYGDQALREATVLKLARALWIVPLTLGAALLRRPPGPGSAPAKGERVKLPWFIPLFVAAAALRSLLPEAAAPVLDGVARVSRTLLVLTLFLIGTGLTRKTLQAVGLRPLIHGVLLWLAVSVLTLLAVWQGASG